MFRKAILIIHGFAGGTYDQEVLATKLELNWRYDVFNFTLPGHDVRLKKNATKDKWIESSEEHLKTLIDAGYKNIYLIGHSMGGVIATYLASKYKEVTKLVLAAPAFRYVTNENGKFELLDALKKTPDLLKTYSKNEIVARMLKLPIPALTEFANLVKEYQDTPKNVSIPTLLIQGTNDKIVPISSSEYVYDNLDSKIKRLVLIDNVTHDVFRGKRVDEIIDIIESFLKGKIKETGIDKI